MIQAGRALVAAALLVALSAVSAPAEDAATPDGADIVNGIPSHLQPTTGALLFVGPDTRNQFLDCSGVLIGCRTVLTAAHCLCKNSTTVTQCRNELATIDLADLRVFFQHSGIHHVREVFIHPSYLRDKANDLAVLRLSQRVEGIEPSLFHDGFPTTIAHETEGVIVGFGNSGDDKVDAGVKRVGEIETAACPLGTGVIEPANICWNFTSPILKPGDDSNLCLMDDGGPLFVDFGNGPEVTGIHSGGGATCEEDSFSFDTNVVRSREWIAEVGGDDVRRDQCSDLGEVGEPWVVVQGGEGSIPRSDDDESRAFSFDIPKDALLVRVTVNGDTTRDGDYDMFVSLGAAVPTRFVADCKRKGVGQFAVCSFTQPDVSHLNILVRHVKPNLERGRSRFQVTVTAFRPVPPHEDPPRGPDMLRYSKRGSGFRVLTWIDDSSNEKGFELQRRPGADATAQFSTRAFINHPNRENYLEQIGDAEVFTYRIRAFNDFGSSEWSNICVVNLPRLLRPTKLEAEDVSANSVALRWRDKATGESAVEVQRRLASDTKFRKLKTLPADSTTYVDHSAEPGEDYVYRVFAKGFPEECIGPSRFSDELAVSTPAS